MQRSIQNIFQDGPCSGISLSCPWMTSNRSGRTRTPSGGETRSFTVRNWFPWWYLKTIYLLKLKTSNFKTQGLDMALPRLKPEDWKIMWPLPVFEWLLNWIQNAFEFQLLPLLMMVSSIVPQGWIDGKIIFFPSLPPSSSGYQSDCRWDIAGPCNWGLLLCPPAPPCQLGDQNIFGDKEPYWQKLTVTLLVLMGVVCTKEDHAKAHENTWNKRHTNNWGKGETSNLISRFTAAKNINWWITCISHFQVGSILNCHLNILQLLPILIQPIVP